MIKKIVCGAVKTGSSGDIGHTNGFPDDSPSGTLDVEANLDFPTANLNGYAFTDGRVVAHWRWLDWSRGNVYTVDPDSQLVAKMSQIAGSLAAKLVDDDNQVVSELVENE